MKKTIAILIIIISIITLVGIVLFKFNDLELPSNKVNTREVMDNSNIPLFEFTSLEGVTFSKYDLDKNKATVIVYFDPDCGLCEKSGELFSKFEKIHKASQVLFVSPNDIERIKVFIEKFNLDKISNVKFYTTDFDSFFKAFKETATPTYIIYDKNGKHIKTINEEVPAKIILRYINASQANE